jgi:D-psicose/D-tagatose/L-ribulose 3-epimerase
MNIKFGVNTWVWTSPLTTGELERLAPHIRGLGFDWIEVPVENVSDVDDPARGREVLQAQGLGVSVCAAMGPDRDLIHSDSAIRENGMRYVRETIDFAAALGSSRVVGPLYSAVGRTWAQTASEREVDLKLLVTQLRALADHAASRGVMICVEPLNRFETSFLNLASQAIELVDRVNHPACQLMLDTFHMNIEETSLGDAIRAAGKRLRHVHTCENDRGAPGSGHVTWNEVAQALRDIDYDGAVVIESFTSQVKSIARAAAIWRTLARSQDALAGDGVKFLRRLLA